METDRVLRSLGYQVMNNIGNGTYSTVQLATSQRHPGKVAIKVIDCKGKSPEFVYKYLPRELAILRRVRHPHIVRVHEIIEMPSRQVYIVMEPAKIDLFHKIKELGRIPIGTAKKWFSQLLSAMVYLHQQDIVHRDLKAENVLLTADGRIKLTDFGLGSFSKGFPDLSRTFCGTPTYAAPEVILGLPYDPKKSDVWSMGIILYAMVCGRLPFRFNFSFKKLLHLQRQPLVYPKGIRVGKLCRGFISYMLQINDFARPSMAEVAQHPWLWSRQKR
ncbi:testis-specific serine/threonine-protein kinase 6-like [Salminus brasiliensis]|uniref:testis-specific serine/threonine-protein kinase 6-like n=1 Tax=Salminus brasiliensis TaxID=930266 RepID=UPI003B838AD9